jgi:hypothetical protein
MRSIKGNKFLPALFLLILAYSCRHINERQMATGRWRFIEVTKNDSVLFPVLETDYIELRHDSTFRYEIALARKNMRGRWDYKDHRLILNYSEPDTTRYYDIEVLSRHDLIFNEGGKHFVLKRLE